MAKKEPQIAVSLRERQGRELPDRHTRGWSHCPSDAHTLGEQLEETRGSVTVTLDLSALGKRIGDLNSANVEAIRLRLTRASPMVTL